MLSMSTITMMSAGALDSTLYCSLHRSRRPLHWACINEHPSVVRLLLEYKADVNATTAAGATPLQLSVANRSQVMVQLLMNVDSQVWWLAVVVQDAVRS